mgnify:CR=1 FL=1
MTTLQKDQDLSLDAFLKKILLLFLPIFIQNCNANYDAPPLMAKGFVDISSFSDASIPAIEIEVRYNTNNNFVGNIKMEVGEKLIIPTEIGEILKQHTKINRI